ncbi:putative nuclease HARBI1 [Palaemon carinicauda]|uniref:putative nuclease HARBI1 n=1 Tax=Palaemon carinicauda TaxID=392227 RepID=UPI0035B69B98
MAVFLAFEEGVPTSLSPHPTDFGQRRSGQKSESSGLKIAPTQPSVVAHLPSGGEEKMASQQTPSTPEEWNNVSNDFWRMWNFPNCLGAIDGKHIVIRQPPGSGSYFYNYKGTYSIILMAICDANSNFIYVDFGVNGRVSDGGVWANTSISQRIINHTAGLPEDTKLPGSDKTLPFVFLADDAFPL